MRGLELNEKDEKNTVTKRKGQDWVSVSAVSRT